MSKINFRNWRKILLVGFIMIGIGEILAAYSLPAEASTPTLSLYPAGGNLVQLNAYGDSGASVIFYYYSSGSLQAQYLGATNSNGYFSTTFSQNTYNVSPNTSVYVTVNNQQSSSVAWPFTGPIVGNLPLSQTNLNMSVGQSQSVTIQGSGNYNVSSNTNPGAVSAVVSGNNLTVNAVAAGNANITVCQNYGGCGTLYVSVSGNYGNNYYNYNYQNFRPISLNPSTLKLSVNQRADVSIYGGAPSYYVAYNSNSNALRANLTGNLLEVTGLASALASVVVCSDSNSCVSLNVEVEAVNNYYYLYNYYPYQYNDGYVLGWTDYNPNYSRNWGFCANENQYCVFSGSRTVRYGANGNYSYQTFSGGVNCSNSVFGDPAFGMVKQCSIQY